METKFGLPFHTLLHIPQCDPPYTQFPACSIVSVDSEKIKVLDIPDIHFVMLVIFGQYVVNTWDHFLLTGGLSTQGSGYSMQDMSLSEREGPLAISVFTMPLGDPRSAHGDVVSQGSKLLASRGLHLQAVLHSGETANS